MMHTGLKNNYNLELESLDSTPTLVYIVYNNAELSSASCSSTIELSESFKNSKGK